MPRYLFAHLSEKYRTFPEHRARIQELNYTFGSHKSFNPVLRRAFVPPFINKMGDPLLDDVEKNKLHRLKVRQGMSFLDEAESQMEKLNLMLRIVAHTENKFVCGIKDENSLSSNYMQLAARKFTTDAVHTITRTLFVYAGASAGAFAGPAGAVIGSLVVGACGSIIVKRLSKNVERTLSHKRIIDSRLKRLYISTEDIDLELSQAYTLGKLKNYSQDRNAVLKYIAPPVKHVGHSLTSPVFNQMNFVYQCGKVKKGPSESKLSKILWLIQELESCLRVEVESIKSSFIKLCPGSSTPGSEIHLSKMMELDEMFNYAFPTYKDKYERSLKFIDIDKTYMKTKRVIYENRVLITNIRNDIYGMRDVSHFPQ